MVQNRSVAITMAVLSFVGCSSDPPAPRTRTEPQVQVVEPKLAFVDATVQKSVQIVPQFEQATIKVEATTIKPLRTLSPWRNTHWSGTRSLAVKDDVVTEIDPGTGKERWSLKSGDGVSLQWLAGNSAVAYFRVTGPEA